MPRDPEPVTGHLENGPATCAACSAPRSGPYCAMCGQRALVRRHSIRGWLGGAFARLFNLERGLVPTLVGLTVDPGTVIRGYIDGRTVTYMHPVAYLVVSFALFILANRLVGFGSGGDNRIFVGAVVPFLAIASRVVFWRSGLNLAEHLILAFYQFSHLTLLLIPAFVFFSVVGGSTSPILFLSLAGAVAFGYTAWVYVRVFPRRPILSALGGAAVLVLGIGLHLWTLFMVLGWMRGT